MAATIRRLDANEAGFDSRLDALTRFEATRDAQIASRVTGILSDVRERGDNAVLEYTKKFDRFEASSVTDLIVSHDELKQALDSLVAADRDALEQAAVRVRDYHQRQRTGSWQYTEADGTKLGQKVTPLDRVGLYVPGGKAAYPSSVLMNALPARVAGVGEIVMVVPTPDGIRNSLVLAAAAVSGVDKVICIGGAQAVAALAYGTDSIAGVDKIVGPGNAYVAEAKRQVYGTVGIDMIAGPSEILVLTDGSAPADWVAMDMFSQAEHDEMAQAILLCPDANYINEVERAIARLLPEMPRAAVIERSLGDRGALIKVADMAQACEIANRIAPEHLEIITERSEQWVDSIRHAGAIFVGAYSSEALGDYCAGPNHVLPTLRTARFSSPLGVYDFQKRSSLINISRQGAQQLGAIAGTLADSEGFAAHASSARMRIGASHNLSGSELASGSEPVADTSDAVAAVNFAVSPLVRAMHGYQVADATGYIKLDAMENPYTLPDPLREQLAARLARLDINRYPLPDYTALKDTIRRVYDIPVGAQIVLGNGSDELIAMLGQAVAGSGRPVLAPVPSFAMYSISSELAGARFVGVNLNADFTLNAESVITAIERELPALVYLAYPNNPTGDCFDDADIERIIRCSPGLVVIDEAYFPFAGRSWMQRLPDFPSLVVMRTVSKIGLAGIRIGYLAADPLIASQLEKVRPPYNISVLDEAAALFALEHISILDQQAGMVRDARAAQAQALAAIPGFTVFPSLTNFLLIRVPDGPAMHRDLMQAGVLVRDVGKMHPMLANCLRVTVSSPEENQALMRAIQTVLS